MQIPEPESEHLWLHQLIGEWTIETECNMGPGEPPMKMTGREVVRPLGKFWTIGEWASDTPEGGACDSIITLGYAPQTKRFTGSFVSSAMSHLWPYDGSLDESKRILTLNSHGPNFSGDGTMANYQDVIEIHTSDYRTLTARVQNPDGNWHEFMVSHFRRAT